MQFRNDVDARLNETRGASNIKNIGTDCNFDALILPILSTRLGTSAPNSNVAPSNEEQIGSRTRINRLVKQQRSSEFANVSLKENVNHRRKLDELKSPTHIASKRICTSKPKDDQSSAQSKHDKVLISSSQDLQSIYKLTRKRPLILPASEGKSHIPRSILSELIPLKIFFKALLRKQGYSIETYPVLETAYYNKPTAYQQKSYGIAVTRAARSGNVQALCKLIKSGLSANPCNKFGESLIHIISRRGKSRNAFDMLRELCQLGSQIHLCDDFGRTPLHDACWTVDPCFQSISLFLDRDINLLRLRDKRGSSPFDYVEKRNQRQFVEFLLAKKDVYWPLRDTSIEQSPPPLILLPPHSRMMPDPQDLMSLDLVSAVADGKINPDEAMMLYPDERKSYRIKRPYATKKERKLGQYFENKTYA